MTKLSKILFALGVIAFFACAALATAVVAVELWNRGGLALRVAVIAGALFIAAGLVEMASLFTDRD